MNLFCRIKSNGLTGFIRSTGAFLTISLLASCTSVTPRPEPLPFPSPLGKEILFDCFSINHAWGYQLSGFFIDGNGTVYRYKRQGAPWHPKPLNCGKERLYDYSDLLNKFTNKTLAAKIDSVIMQSKAKQIELADSGAISHAKQKIADAGQNLCLAYRYGPGENVYRPVALGSFGVTEKIIGNSSAAAKSLMNWLMTDVAKQINR